MSGWRDPAIVLGATAFGIWILPGLCGLARKARAVGASRRRRRDAATPARCPRPFTPFEWNLHAMASRWDATTEQYVKDRLR